MAAAPPEVDPNAQISSSDLQNAMRSGAADQATVDPRVASAFQGPAVDPRISAAYEGQVTPVLSQWNNFWREFDLAPDTLHEALVSTLESGYDHSTGTGARFSDRSPDQLRATLQEAQYKLADLHSQFDASDMHGTEYGRTQLQAQIANVNADIQGMQHQFNLKTGVEKPGWRDSIGAVLSGWQKDSQNQVDERRGLKPPSTPIDQTAGQIALGGISRALGQIPFAGALIGDTPPPNIAEQRDPLSQLAGQAGSMLGVAPAFALGGEGIAGMAPEVMAMALQRSQAERDEARAAGLDQEAQDKAGNLGLLAGAAEAPFYRMVFGKFVGHERPLTVGELGTKMLKNFAVGAGAGAEQSAASNIIAVASGIDPNRKLTDGMLQSILANAGMMGVTGGLVDTASYGLGKLGAPKLDLYRRPDEQATEPPPTAQARAMPARPETAGMTADQLQEHLAHEQRRADYQADPESVVRQRAYEISQERQRLGVQGTPEDDWAKAQQETQDLYGAGSETPEERAARIKGETGAAAAPDTGLTPAEQAWRAVRETFEQERQLRMSEEDLRGQLADLRQRLGPRVAFRVMSPDQLPNRYKLELARQGVNPGDYSAFYDKGFNEFFVNPQGFDSRAQLNDAIIRKFVVNSMADRARIFPVLSFDEASDSPGVIAMQARRPNADAEVSGAYDKTSGNVYLNMGRILATADPIREAIETANHEIAGHQGTRTFFKGDFPQYDNFLDRVYNGMTRSGAGDRIAARFGMNMQQLADHYGFDMNTPEGQRGLAEELLARYAERFDPEELNRAPSIIKTATDFIKRGLFNKQGLNFTEADALHFLQGAYRYTDPELSRTTAMRPGETLLPAQRRITEYGEVTLADAAADALNRAETTDAARAVSRGPVRNEAARGTPGRTDSILSAGGKLLQAARWWLDPKAVQSIQFNSDRLNREDSTAEHNSWLSPDTGIVLKETRPTGDVGPYGLWPALPGRSVRREDAYYHETSPYYATTAASPSQYLSSIDLRNRVFPGADTHFEGFTAYDGDRVARILTSQPFVDDRAYRESTEQERNVLFARRGFEPIDRSTYYNPDTGVLAFDVHGANLRVRADNPNDFRVIDGTFSKLDGPLRSHFDALADGHAYDEWSAARDAADREMWSMNNENQDALYGEPTQEELDRDWVEQELARGKHAINNDEAIAKAQDIARPHIEHPEARATVEELMRMLSMKAGPAIPQDVMDQLKATLAKQKPGEIVRMSAIKGTLIPDDPVGVRQFRAAPDQLLTEKRSIPAMQKDVEKIYSQHLGNTDSMIADFLSGKIAKDWGEDVAAQLYKNLSRDIRIRRQGEDGPGQQRLDLVQQQLNKAFDERGTVWAREGPARNDAWYGAEGMLAKYRAQVGKGQQRLLLRDGAFQNAVRAVRRILGDVNGDVRDHLKDLFLTADRANADNSWKSLPQQYADWVSNSIVQQAKNMGMPAREVPALEELFNRFRQTISQQAKENGIPMDRPARQRMSASDRITEALSNWDWMRKTLEDTVAQAHNTFADEEGDDQGTLQYKERMRNAFDGLLQNAQMPWTEAQLARFLPERQVRIGDLVMQHRSIQASTMDSLADYLVKNSNLNPAQAQLVQDAITNHLGQALDVQRQAEFEKIIRDSAGKKFDPNRLGVSMQKLINLIHLGAFDDPAVADALAPSFGYQSYDPEFAGKLRDLGDKLEMYKQQGREGVQTERIKLDMLDALNDWRRKNLGWMQNAADGARNVFLGNILTGIPTHVIAMMSDFFNGTGQIAGFMARLPTMEARLAAAPRVLKYMMDGFIGAGGGFDRFRHIMSTGVDPNRAITIRDIMENAGEPGYVPGRPEANMTGWLAPYQYIFRSVTALHALMRNGIEEPVEWLYTFDQLARDPNLSMHEALSQADEAINGNYGYIQAAKQRVAAEGLTGVQARIRMQELIDNNREPMTRDIGKLFGERTIFTQPPEGILGTAARALQGMVREVPGLRYIVPFTNIVANVLDNSINWSPVGFLRSAHPDLAEGYFRDVLKKAPSDEIGMHEVNLLRQDLMAKATMGTIGLAGLWAISKIPGPNGQPLMSIHGAGPTDPKKLHQQMDEGWMPNSVSFNLPGMPKPYYIPFEALPVSLGLTFIGNVEDSYRYMDGKDALARASYIATQTGASMVDRSFLRGIKDLLDSFAGQADEQKGAASMMRLMSNTVASSIPYAGSAMATQLYRQFADPRVYAQGTGWPIAGDVLRQVPFMNWIDGSKPRLNVLGEPVTSYPYKRMMGQLASQDPIWRYLGENGVFLSDPRAPKILGQKMDPEQMYNFTGFHGRYLKELMQNNLGVLQSLTDPDVRQKMMDHFGRTATKRAKADVISGNEFQPEQ